MEPNNINPDGGSKNSGDGPARPYDDLKAEGIDIVSGSGRSEDNEFTGEEIAQSHNSSDSDSDLDMPLPGQTEINDDNKDSQEVTSSTPSASQSSRQNGAMSEPVRTTRAYAPQPVANAKPQQFVNTYAPKQNTSKPPVVAAPTPAAPQEPARMAVTFDDLKNMKPGAVVEKAPEQPLPEVKNDPSIKPLRTFKSDSEAILGMGVKPKAPEPKPVPAPLPPKPEPKPTYEPTPGFSFAPKNPTPPAPVAQSEPKTREQEKPQNNPAMKPIRTFKTDAEETVKYQNVSVVDIAVAEQKKKEESRDIESAGQKHSSTGIFIISVLAIVVLLAGGWYYWFTTTQTETGSVAPSAIRTLIPSSKAIRLPVGGVPEPLATIAKRLENSNAGLGNIYALVPTMDATSTEPLAIGNILKNTHIPDELERSLGTNYMFGTYTYDVNSPFLILKNTFFQNAFAGMLEWEKDGLRNDFLPIIRVSHPTESVIPSQSVLFEDAIVSNIDARVLKNSSGETIFVYAFADKDTIVIATTQNALKYLLDKLLAVRTIQ